jgi:hypothetical protein
LKPFVLSNPHLSLFLQKKSTDLCTDINVIHWRIEMSTLFERFRNWQVDLSKRPHVRACDRHLIGSEFFIGIPGFPLTTREQNLDERLKIQRMFQSKGRDPDSLKKIPIEFRDEKFWEVYVDSLMVFERDEEALRTVIDAIKIYPRNHLLWTDRFMIEERIMR